MTSTTEPDDVLYSITEDQVQIFHKPYTKDKILSIESKVKDLVLKILERTARHDPFFAFKDVILSGSVSEGLKVRQFNEFDFLLVLNSKFEVREDEDLRPGFVNIISDQKLHPFTLRRKFYRAIMSASRYLDLADNVLVRVNIHSVSVKLHIVPDTLDCSHGDIDVDLVLALKAPQSFWPRCSNEWKERPHNERLPAEVIEEIITNGVHFVARYESGSEWQDKESQQIQWRVSFSVAESIILRRLTETQRNAFKIMKVILEKQRKKLFCEKISGNLTDSFVDKLTTSYHIKTILFHLNEDALLSKVGEREYLICVLKALLDSLKNMHLPHYFIPGVNLFNGLKDLSSGKLWRESRGKLYQLTIQQWENFLETLPEDLSELRNEALPGQVVIGIFPLAPLPEPSK